jgi:hypothetical protein
MTVDFASPADNNNFTLLFRGGFIHPVAIIILHGAASDTQVLYQSLAF